ncbi:peptidoglycan DD-metalloendopeptidase family protein [Streptomyces sp. NPDC127072]|uniref:M23 family metallopeptidase n=1 Tax=Streptomyces sp. NPDC127072 TaxID=3347129 RepID=UPI0036689EB7
MNDRPPSGIATPPAPASDAASTHYASYGGQEAQHGEFTTYDGYPATGFETGPNAPYATGNFEAPAFQAATAFETTSFATDPLFGDMSGSASGSYDATQWNTGGHQAPDSNGHQTLGTGSHQTLNYDPYAAQHQAAYDTGSYETTAWAAGYQQLSDLPAQHPNPDATGQWDANAWLQPQQPADHTQQWSAPTQDTGAYDATQWNTGGGQDAYEHEQPRPESYEHQRQPASEPLEQQATATFEQVSYEQPAAAEDEFERPADGQDSGAEHDEREAHDGHEAHDRHEAHDEHDAPLLLDDMEDVTPAPRSASRSAGRSRRRSPAKRSALLTVAVPSACVMGVTGIAAASVVSVGGDETKDTAASAPDAAAVKPSAANNKLDTQLASLSAGADDFADRASRTQERIDLKAQQEAQRKKAAEAAATKERLRPKFAIPVAQHGLSAYFGQAGVNWMSIHTGIDFPVSYGTTVMAATDGTVRTQWNSAYGNMMIVTAMDGTETWYCHLSSYQVASGTTVKAGDAIANSGNSGNSTGPHLHFEVRPAGGSAIDPLAWLRSHGLDPS